MAIKKETRLKRATSVGKLLNPIVKKTLGKNGFSNMAILSDWRNIVGKDMAQYSRPLRITFIKNKKNKGVLHIAIHSAFATDMNHRKGMILEMVNQYLGYNAIDSIRLEHNFTEKEQKKVDNPSLKHNADKQTDQQKLDAILNDIQDEALKNRLDRIGRHILKK